MDRATGRMLTGVDELEQSIDEILGTPLGDRVMRAEFGSNLFKLTDNVGLTPGGRAKVAQSCAEAIRRWETRVRLDRVTTEGTSDGAITQTLYGTVVSSGASLKVRR
jgi:hypothetical protein